jgi:acyl-homoserine-lactone acylase
MRPPRRRTAIALLTVALVAAACSTEEGDASAPGARPPVTTGADDGDGDGGNVADGGYAAELRRTSDGVAHVTAEDWGGLGFGQGWAYAEDRACTLLDQVMKVRGERARYFGAGAGNENQNSDLAYRHLGLYREAEQRWADQPAEVVDLVEGYAAGFSAQVADVGADGVAGWCAGEPWVGPITTTDLYAVVADVLLLASSRNLIAEIGRAQPPAPVVPPAPVEGAPVEDVPVEGAPVEGAFAPPGQRDLAIAAGASNGWALGADRSTTGGGALLANPHFPWEGDRRLWETQLTIPGELDVYGVSLGGLPGVQIGFNDAVAWTHTVSAGNRFTLYRYAVDPANPTTYAYGGELRPMEPTEVAVDVLDPDGFLRTVTRTMYATQHGPVLDLAPVGWTTDTVIAIRDANAEITTVLAQFLGMATAGSMDDFQAVHEEQQGIPWVNTVATSADGRAWYHDGSATPNLSPEAIAAWQADRAAGGFAAIAYDQAGVVLLDGSNPLNEWVDDPAAPAPGLLPYDELPQLERSDWVFNANDSHWLAHPDELLTGFSPLTGEEGTPVSARTRMNAVLLREDDSPWGIPEMQEALFTDRSLHAELLLDDVVAACTGALPVDVDGAGVDLAAGCAALAGWDGTYTLEARGAALWRELLGTFGEADRTNAGPLYATPFDPADPVGTPNALAADPAPVLLSLGRAVLALERAGLAVDVALGEVQFEVRTGDRIPIHGGFGNLEGIANAVGCCATSTTSAPLPATGAPIAGTQLRDLPGYPVSTGASFVLTVQYGPDGPEAEGFLTYGNPDDPAAPDYRADLDAFSAGRWRPILFTAAAIAADPGLEVTEVSGD